MTSWLSDTLKACMPAIRKSLERSMREAEANHLDRTLARSRGNTINPTAPIRVSAKPATQPAMPPHLREDHGVTNLSVELLNQLRDAAGHHQQPLRVTHEFYNELVHFEPPEPPFGRPAPTSPPIPVGTEVVVVTNGSENVRLVNGVWTFVPSGGAP